MMETHLQKNVYECDFCGELRVLEDMHLITNPALVEKQMLVFCKASNCYDQYLDEVENDPHRFCMYCEKLLNKVIHKTMCINGEIYHESCGHKYLKEKFEEGK